MAQVLQPVPGPLHMAAAGRGVGTFWDQGVGRKELWRKLISSFSFTDIILESSRARGGRLISCPGRCEMQPGHLQPAAGQSKPALPALTPTHNCSGALLENFGMLGAKASLSSGNGS